MLTTTTITTAQSSQQSSHVLIMYNNPINEIGGSINQLTELNDRTSSIDRSQSEQSFDHALY
jgi:hypothetical protein